MNYDSIQSMWLMYNYIIDWEEFNLISKILKSDDQVCDIGTNVGYYTVWMSKFIKAPGKIHSFEPHNKIFPQLQANVELNDLGSVICLNNMAVFEKNGTMNFTTIFDVDNHLSEQKDENSIVVQTIKLDTYAEQNQITSFKYVKMDVEGFEYFILKGANDLLESQKIAIFQMEINQSVSNANLTVGDILELLNSYNYQLCGYDVNLNKLFPLEYTEERENYFAVYNLDKINRELAANDNECNM